MTRRYSLLLDECLIEYCRCEPDENIKSALDKLFDFDYGLPEEYRKLFEYKFFMRYRYYNINYDSFRMFKSQLESKLLELSPKYRKLYASENVINNPFVNYASQDDTFTRQRGRNKTYGADNARSFGNTFDNSGGVSVSRTGTSDGNSSASLGSGESVEKDKNTSDSKDWELNKYTDSPQDPVDNEDTFNDGYITTKSRQDNRKASINSGAKEGWRKDANQITSEGFSNTENYSDNINQREGVTQKQSYTDNYAVNALQNTEKRINQKYGLSGVTVSNIIQEWRDTFITIDKDFLDELKPLFMMVY